LHAHIPKTAGVKGKPRQDFSIQGKKTLSIVYQVTDFVPSARTCPKIFVAETQIAHQVGGGRRRVGSRNPPYRLPSLPSASFAVFCTGQEKAKQKKKKHHTPHPGLTLVLGPERRGNPPSCSQRGGSGEHRKIGRTLTHGSLGGRHKGKRGLVDR